MSESQSLEDRLRTHARAFDGLLALIPAKQYYSEDKSDQWQKKKQTKEQARAAKLAKLDPNNHKSALDVFQENELKRKREDEGLHDDVEGLEKPREGMKLPKPGKKQKTVSATKESEKTGDLDIARQNKKEKKRQQAQGKKAKKEAKQAQKKTREESQNSQKVAGEEEDEQSDDQAIEGDEVDLSFLKSADLTIRKGSDLIKDVDQTTSAANTIRSEQVGPDSASASSSSPKSEHSAEEFSAQPSGTSSISSTGTAGPLALNAAAEQKERSNSSPQSSSIFGSSGSAPRLTMSEMQERLRQRIAEKRAQRNADIDGRPARTRAELIESRRKKQDQRKATKKALRQQAKEEETRKKEEAIARGSPLMSPTVHSPPHSGSSANLSFGRIAFENGQMMTADLSGTMDLSKRKGPVDTKTALLMADARDAKITEMDAEKRVKEQEKNMWLNARKRAHGERVRDDGSLLKKALKRKQKQKDKSANDWNKRINGVKAAQESKQRRREENLAKRKEDRGKKGSKSVESKNSKPKKRPGFEGSFRSGGRK